MEFRALLTRNWNLFWFCDHLRCYTGQQGKKNNENVSKTSFPVCHKVNEPRIAEIVGTAYRSSVRKLGYPKRRYYNFFAGELSLFSYFYFVTDKFWGKCRRENRLTILIVSIENRNVDPWEALITRFKHHVKTILKFEKKDLPRNSNMEWAWSVYGALEQLFAKSDF